MGGNLETESFAYGSVMLLSAPVIAIMAGRLWLLIWCCVSVGLLCWSAIQ